MHADRAAATPEATHQELSGLTAGMIAAVTGRSCPAPHVSFFAMGGTPAQALELRQMVNALFGLDLPADTVLRSPTPDAFARSIETAWFERGGSAADLHERIAALSDYE
jgi:Phosphopantetheine attachment site